MMVVFVSQCEKRALPRTRRVLDAFANRIGDNTWQTLITEEGLQTAKRMLRQTASKSTAVSCHWVRSRSRSQFLWVVGNRRKFNAEGIVPVNSTEQGLPTSDAENNWKYLPLVKAFTGLAGLLHDWGKSTALFQEKLDPHSKNAGQGDPLRHEWISCLLFVGLIRSSSSPDRDGGWLESLLSQSFDEMALQASARGISEGSSPLGDLPDAASLLLWLILSHHRLPKPENKDRYGDRINDTPQQLLRCICQNWGYENPSDDFSKRLPGCYVFPKGGLSDSPRWLNALSVRARQLQECLPLFAEAMKDGSWRTIAHHARLCLMLGDHSYSSRPQDTHWPATVELFANTHRDGPNKGEFKQKLDEHLVNVAEVAVSVCRLLPSFEREVPYAKATEQLKPPRNPTPELKRQFGWQDKAVTAIQRYRQESDDKVGGYFIVNMASTGRGKTLANAKIMQALSADQQSLRFILALGLRTLTLQTGDEYRERVGLDEQSLAVLIGSRAVLELHRGVIEKLDEENQPLEHEAFGSESYEPLLAEQEEVHGYGEDNRWQDLLPEEDLSTVLTGPKERALLYAPVLACTIDHIISATETTRGGRYILPSLRLMSSDLVIDEIDDFTGEDLVAIGRLIHLAGMLGRKVMISSATIPPDLALAYFTAYQKGWTLFAASRHQNPQVACGWTDEFKTQLVTVHQNELTTFNYQSAHQRFVEKRIAKLRAEPVKRRADIVPLAESQPAQSREQAFFATIQQAIVTKHLQHHEVDAKTGRKVSFGVVRCANIPPCIELTEYLLAADWPDHVDVRAMAYHSQQVLLLRHAQEEHLDQVLKRKVSVNDPNSGAYHNSVIRQHLDSSDHEHLIFVLVATPVEEVGRDHDFDWAVVEPSSYRSIIQLGGRVRRHRGEPVNEAPNIALLQYNLKGYRGEKRDVFSRPGYEQGPWQLSSHDLFNLVDEKALAHRLDAVPRITKDVSAAPSKQLDALEHFAISRTLGCHYLTEEIQGGDPARSPKNLWGYTDDYWWMTALPNQFNRFRNSAKSLNLYLVMDERGRVAFQMYDSQSGWMVIERRMGIRYQPLRPEQEVRLWLRRDYAPLVIEQSELRGTDTTQTTRVLGEINLQNYQEGNCYRYSDQLGLLKDHGMR